MSSEFDDEGVDLQARQHELASVDERHPQPETIAELLEDAPRSADGERAAAHIVRCRRCFALYAEMARTEFGLRAVGSESPIPASFLDAALRLGGPTRVRQHGRRAQWLVAVAAAGVFAAAIAVLEGVVHRPTRSVDREIVAVVESSMPRALPEGWSLDGRTLPGSDPVYRGVESADPALSNAVARLADMYNNTDTRTPEIAELLVTGCLAEHRDDHAREFLSEARSLYPTSHKLALLEAALDYRMSRVDKAESTLRSLADDPAAAANLKLLLEARGHSAGAQPTTGRSPK